MKYIFILLTGLATVLSCGNASSTETQEPKKSTEVAGSYEDDNGIVWVTDVEEAFKLSEETNKPVFAFFTGKEWCGWCKKLVAQVFVHDEFITFSKENFIMLELDFPRRDRSKITPAMVDLQRQFGVRGYPTVLLLDSEKNLIGKTGYQRMNAEQYVQHLSAMIQ